MASLFDTLRRELDDVAAASARALFAVADTLISRKKERFNRVLPLGEYLVDRWDKARLLGWGEGSSIYDSSIVFGDVKMGKNCWVGPWVILDGSGGLEIGDGCVIGAGSQIYTHDNMRETVDGHPRGSKVERSPVKIGNCVYIAPGVLIARGVTIGDRVAIGAHSVILSDVPSGMKVAGAPARILGSVDG